MTCARCGRRIKAEEAVYSPFRSAREGRKVNYCGPQSWKRCDELFKKKQAAS